MRRSTHSKGAEEKEKCQEAITAFKKAIPIYQRLIRDYANTQYGPSSYRILGICYASSEQFIQAADTYLKYIEFENKRHKPDYFNMLKAKLQVAENYYQGGRFLQKKADDLTAKTYSLKDKTIYKRKMKEVEKLDEEAKNLFVKAIEQLSELIGQWFAHGTPYSKLNDPKAQNIKAEASYLLGWVYDLAGEKDSASKEFDSFIQSFPDNPKVPSCMLRLGEIFIELGYDTDAELVLYQLISKFPNSPQSKEARILFDRSTRIRP